MKRETKLVQKELQEQEAHLGQASQPNHEFATVEDLLRFDAAKTEVPPAIARRLAASAQAASNPTVPGPRPWWQRFWRSAE